MTDQKIQADLLGDMSRYENCRDLRSLFQKFGADAKGHGPASDHRIAIDLHDTGTAFVVRASITGACEKTIDVEIDGCEVRLRVAPDKTHLYSDIQAHPCNGAQYRRFTLAQPVEPSDALIRRYDDLFELTLPKKRGPSVIRIDP